MKKYYVYAIGSKESLSYPYDNCYIRVTSDLERRWKGHEKSSYTVGKFIRKYLLAFEDNMLIIFEGTEDECFLMEEKFRPLNNMGLNEATGGKGGYTSYSKERNRKISEKTKETRQRKKWSTSKNRNFSGSKNPRAKIWKVIDRQGEIHTVHGNLHRFCKEHQILASCLRYNVGHKIEEPRMSGTGGYRAKNEKSKMLRMNTVGWSLIGDVS